MSFWNDEQGNKITGEAKDAFLGDFGAIPDGTIAEGYVKSFMYVENDSRGRLDRFFEVKWKLLNGDFKNREVSQKLKVFDGKPESIKRNKNMLMLIMKLFEFKPTHGNQPTDAELSSMVNKIAVIKIGEWEMVGDKGDLITGNNVKEVHQSGSMQPETGVHRPSATSTSTPAQGREKSAFDRERDRQSQSAPMDDLDVPF